MEDINSFVKNLNGILFHDYVVYALLLTGVLFTLWSGFGQYRALTHGVAVIRGKYDKKSDPGAINHFQALSAALSATVGLGNIAGVALAVALGGPGAIFWMWIIGILGMALKMTEVTQSMLHRNIDDPSNPHGGPMFVVDILLKNRGGKLGASIGGLFCLTLILSAITGGNMFQSWNVASVTTRYFELPGLSGMKVTENYNPETLAIGILLAIIVGAVIIGGIKRIGAVAGKLVPLMCGFYLFFGLIVLLLNVGKLPGLLMLIISSGLGLEDAEVGGAFLGGTVGMAALWGIKRALFSSEAGQGSAPIAHSAAKCDEPVREGVVAGLEPFIDTLVVCTITALIILSSGAWNREAEAVFPDDIAISTSLVEGQWTISTPALPQKTDDAKRINRVSDGAAGWSNNDPVFMIIEAQPHKKQGTNLYRLEGMVHAFNPSNSESTSDDAKLSDEEIQAQQLADQTNQPVYIVRWKSHDLLDGDGKRFTAEDGTQIVPQIRDRGIYVSYPGAQLTAHAFDRVIPGLGKWLVVIAAWLFAISTMISWSYYGEQGIHYFFGKGVPCEIAVVTYRISYTLLIAVSTIGFIKTDHDLDMWTTLGLGAMLVANIPIMWIFGAQSMKAYHTYMGKLKRGEFEQHASTDFTGEDVE